MKKFIYIIGSFFFFSILSLGGMYGVVSFSTKEDLYSDISTVPHKTVGLVLGTTQWVGTGEENIYFSYRMDAAEALYKNGTVDYLLLSGDNSTLSYNEPINMQKELMERGIPKDRLILDYAGFRTYDSIVRAKEVFGQDSFLVISQKFHNERAVFIAKEEGISAIAYNAQAVSGWRGLKTNIREVLARTKMFWDFIIGTEPKYLGEKIQIGETPGPKKTNAPL